MNWHGTGFVFGMKTPIERDTEAGKASLFENLAPPSQAQVEQARAQEAGRRAQGSPRLLDPNRLQVELRAADLESMLPEDHWARLVWGYVVRHDLSRLIEAIKARGSNAGCAAFDPRQQRGRCSGNVGAARRPVHQPWPVRQRAPACAAGPGRPDRTSAPGPARAGRG